MYHRFTGCVFPAADEYLRRRDDGSLQCRLMRRMAPFFRGRLRLRYVALLSLATAHGKFARCASHVLFLHFWREHRRFQAYLVYESIL